jgi:hypothetical protein
MNSQFYCTIKIDIKIKSLKKILVNRFVTKNVLKRIAEFYESKLLNVAIKFASKCLQSEFWDTMELQRLKRNPMFILSLSYAPRALKLKFIFVKSEKLSLGIHKWIKVDKLRLIIFLGCRQCRLKILKKILSCFAILETQYWHRMEFIFIALSDATRNQWNKSLFADNTNRHW